MPSSFISISDPSRNGKFTSNKEAYHQLYKAVDKKDNAIAKRYDGLTGSKYLITVAAILHDGYISEDDIKYFSDETKRLSKTGFNFGKENKNINGAKEAST